ncbi:MAG: hypothetical protein ACFFED_17555 [Candidatus Thorarchaeota archaeon]
MQFSFDFFDFFFSFFGLFFIIPIIVFLIIFIFVITKICQTSQSMTQGGWTIEAPSFVIPHARTRSDGSEMKTVRLPDKCPSCNASLSYEGIDWVGPMEAKCTYCGSTVKARFENV